MVFLFHSKNHHWSRNVHRLPIESHLLSGLLPGAIAFARYVYFRACMASSTAPDLFLVHDLIIEHVAFMLLPISNSQALLGFGLLRTDICVLVLPHAAVSVVRVIRASINRATGDFFPADFRTYEIPCRRVIDATAYQDIVWGMTKVARLAIS